MATRLEGGRALLRSEGFHDLTEYSIGQTLDKIRGALSGQDAERIRQELKHVLMMSEKGQHKFVEGFTELAIELLHEGTYSDLLLFLGVLG